MAWSCTVTRGANGVPVIHRVENGQPAATWDRKTKEWRPITNTTGVTR